MPSDGDASVLPSQPWTQDGSAIVTPLPPFPDLAPRTLSLDNRTAGNFTVRKRDYPGGLVVVQTDHEPQTTPAVLPILSSSDEQVHVTGDNFVVWPDGFVVWFTG